MVDTYIKISGQFRPAVMSLATFDDVTRLGAWLEEYKDYTDSRTGDILEYVVDSVTKLGKYAERGRCAADETSFLAKARLGSEEEEEVAGLFVLKCAALNGEIVGFIFLRRLWDRSLVMDYLARCPYENLRLESAGYVAGGLLLGACLLAQQLKAPYLWWETTEASHSLYVGMLTKADIKVGASRPKSNLFISKTAYLRFIGYVKGLPKS